MTSEQKQIELTQYRDIVLATLNYLLERLGGSVVYDQLDAITDYYQQQKIQTEKYFRQRRLDKLQQRFIGLTKELQYRADLAFAPYIREKTGYDIDIFENLRKRVSSIIAQNEIRSQKDLNDIGAMFHFYHKTSADGEKAEKLKTLLTNYSEKTHATLRKRKTEYSEVISRTEKDGIEEVTIKTSASPKPTHFEEQETISPDGKRRLRVTQWGDGKNASTYVTIGFPTASGTIYGTTGIRPNVNAFWKNNSTIIIETKREYTSNIKHREMRSFNDIIIIEYIER